MILLKLIWNSLSGRMVGLLLSGQGGSRDWCDGLAIGTSEGLTKFPSSFISCHRISEVKESVPSGKCVETQTNQQWASLLNIARIPSCKNIGVRTKNQVCTWFIK